VHKQIPGLKAKEEKQEKQQRKLIAIEHLRQLSIY